MSRIHPTNLSIKSGVVVAHGNKGAGGVGDEDDDVNGGSSSNSSSSGSTIIINNPPSCSSSGSSPDPRIISLTVWKRSSMSFQGTDGFTVFDQRGRLAFRVDNYSRNNRHLKGGLLLMDGAGKALLTLKPQEHKLMQRRQYWQWNGFKGDHDQGLNPSNLLFSMRRSSSSSGLFIQREDEEEAQVFMGGRSGGKKQPDFRISGSFRRRNCKITSTLTGEVVAKIARKKLVNNPTVLLGDDVFSLLLLQPPFIDSQLIMAFLIILDRICVNPFTFTPFFCY